VHWTALGSVKSKIANTPEAKAIQCYTLATKTNTHYIKIVAKNAGLLPSWHEGKENPSILFMDEVIIK
jgi:hypothetical protein